MRIRALGGSFEAGHEWAAARKSDFAQEKRLGNRICIQNPRSGWVAATTHSFQSVAGEHGIRTESRIG